MLRDYAADHPNTRIVTQTNHGQGYARNRALEQAQGEYVLFVDADDWIDSVLLEKCVVSIEECAADLVHFNWQMAEMQKGQESIRQFNREVFAGRGVLEGEDCEHFLEKRNYFSWDSLYRKSLLDEYNIRFGEGYIYEDNEFIVKVASHASKIALIDEPLYTMRHNPESSTRVRDTTDRHAKDFLRAMRQSFSVLEPRTEHSSFYLAAYCLEKFVVYYQMRIPRSFRRQFLHEFVDVLHGVTILQPSGSNYRFLRKCLKQNVFASQKYATFYTLLHVKTKLVAGKARLKGGLSKLQH
jgi:glycosyltransferase involved in cell wall biosynthesis